MRYWIGCIGILFSLNCSLTASVDTRGVSHSFAGTTMAIHPVVFVGDFPALKPISSQGGPFTVGHITFSGGYITEQHPTGLQNISKTIEVTAVEKYREEVSQWLSGAIQSSFAKRNIRVIFIEGPHDGLSQAPMLDEVRGSNKRDGSDNVSLPRFLLTPQSIPSSSPILSTVKADGILVPIVVNYYTHNAGWFSGQTWGCSAGGRIRVLLALYDGDSGALLAWKESDASFTYPDIFSPNNAQTQDALIALEQALGQRLIQKFPG